MRICLYNLEQVAVLALDEQGPEYFQLSGGPNLVEVSARGLLAPISNDAPLDMPEAHLMDQLAQVVKGAVGLNAQQAQAINALLMEVSSSDRYEVNMDQLAHSNEAWVHVRVFPQGDYSTFDNAEPFQAILTWKNRA